MSLQTCQRCRKRRIKCDLDLPACGNCSTAEVECLFYDDSLRQEIPRSYLHALQQKVDELQREIKTLTERNKISSPLFSDEAKGLKFSQSDFHLGITDSYEHSPSTTIYLGPGNSAQLIERLLNGAADWCISSNYETAAETLSRLLTPPIVPSEVIGSSTFPLSIQHQSLDFPTTVPPATQRTLILHYFKVVHPHYPLISSEQEANLLNYEDPFRWGLVGTHRDSLIITAVFAISTTLVARDLEPKFSTIASMCTEVLQKAMQNTTAYRVHSIATRKQMIKSLGFLAILELVNPVSGRVWNLVGRALASMEQLRTSYQAASMVLDDEFRRLELSLLKLESSLALHYRRPSPFCETWPILNPNGSSLTPITSNRLLLYNQRAKITQGFSIIPLPPSDYFENLIPADLRASSSEPHLSISSAMMYIALHPLFTTSPSDIFSDRPMNELTLDLFKTVALAASTMIEHFAQWNAEYKITCIWMAAELVLEAGAIWASYLVKLQRLRLGTDTRYRIGKNSAMTTLLKCSTLLASFAERWKDGAVYMETWDTLLSMVWAILD